MKLRWYSLVVALHCLMTPCIFAVPAYQAPRVYARTGVTSWNLPAGSSIASATAALNDRRDVVVDVNVVGGTGLPGLFYGEWNQGTPSGGIVAHASDTILGDPLVNNQQATVYAVGLSQSLFAYDHPSHANVAINYPLGITGGSNLRVNNSQLIGGRLAVGFAGDVLGTFPRRTSGFPSLTVYAADRGVDVSSSYSFLYTPDVSESGGIGNAPRIAAKVSTLAGFDFEEIRIFDADGSSTLIAVETETDPLSPFSEFITNGVSISDNGIQVAFQATRVGGPSGIYRYNDQTRVIDLIAEEGMGIVNTVDIFAPDINDHGLVVFRGRDSLGTSSVFVGDGSQVVRLAGEGDVVMTDLGPRQLGRRDLNNSQSGAPRINNVGDVSYILQYFDPANPSSIADGSLVFLRPAAPSGDFDGDGTYSCSDIDALIVEIVTGNHPTAFDLNGDGLVNVSDRDAWLAIAGASQLASGQPYLLGDANLDGSVDGSDFNIWNAHKFTVEAAWCAGDFTADGVIDGADFNVWNAHKFQSADAISTVPEPGIILSVIVAVWFMRTRRSCTSSVPFIA